MDEIEQFFTRFVADFPAFDGRLIASRYSVPYLSVNSTGEITVYESDEAIAESFQNYLDQYAAKGITSCRYQGLETQAVENNIVFAMMNWEMLGAEGEVIQTWRESYNLHKVDGQWRIFTSTDHEFNQ